ncbi:hypothetical protein MKX03_035011, partial [Papaver bracteatum]
MGWFQSNSPWVGLFLFASVGCLALLIQMPACTEAVLPCAPNERYVSKIYKGVSPPSCQCCNSNVDIQISIQS